MRLNRLALLKVTNYLIPITIILSVFIVIDTAIFHISPSGLPFGIWPIFNFLSVSTIVLSGFMVVLSLIDIRVEKTEKQQLDPVKITLEFDGMPITVEACSKDRVEEILQLMREMQVRQPLSSGYKARAVEDSASISADKVEVDKIG